MQLSQCHVHRCWQRLPGLRLFTQYPTWVEYLMDFHNSSLLEVSVLRLAQCVVKDDPLVPVISLHLTLCLHMYLMYLIYMSSSLSTSTESESTAPQTSDLAVSSSKCCQEYFQKPKKYALLCLDTELQRLLYGDPGGGTSSCEKTSHNLKFIRQ